METPGTPTGQPVVIQRGSIFIYRVFDIAEEIDLRAVERILSQEGGESRLRLKRGGRNAVIIRNAPVRLSLGETEIQVGGVGYRVDTVATVWDYGVVSISFQLPIRRGMAWSELLGISAKVNGDAQDGTNIDVQARAKSQELAKLFAKALKRPSQWNTAEDYAIYFFEELQGIQKASDLVKQVNLPALILGETHEPLSGITQELILQNLYQYAENDLVLIDWNSAVVYEPSGSREINDVLEFALTHLLELRYYDDLLDRRLTDLYDSIEERRHNFWRNQFSKISREANTRYIEFSEFMERVDNSLKVVGDFYLATIFRGAVRRFRIPDWQQSITRKMNLLARVSELLLGEANVYRSHLLEIIIILLIAFEIVSTMIKAA